MEHETEPDLLADLTPAQREAVTHIEGPLLILAGAGSGKTRVITRRVAYLLQQGVRPGNILAITFTNKAAGEMRQRVEALVPGSRVWISTFHSLGARLLRQYADRLGLDRNFTIYDQTDRSQHRQDGPGRRRPRQRPLHARHDRRGHQQGEEPAAQPGTLRRARQRLLRARPSPTSTRSTRSGCATPTPWTSTTCSTGRPWRSSTTRSCAPNSTRAFASC